MPSKTTSNVASDLGPRQKAILEYILSTVEDRGYPPSVREIAEAVGLTSPSTVHAHLEALQQKGYLTKAAAKPRAIQVRYARDLGPVEHRSSVRDVPLLGRVAAGTPTLAVEDVEEIVPLPAEFLGKGDFFMLRVKGDSMIEAGINDGDFVVVRKQETATNGDIVVALLGDEATVKTLAKVSGKTVLRPENRAMKPIDIDASTAILGKVVALLRSYTR